MSGHLNTFVSHLLTADMDVLKTFYKGSTKLEKFEQIRFLYLQSQKSEHEFANFQAIAAQLCAEDSLLPALLKLICTEHALTFFIPILQMKDNYKCTDHKQRTFLHYLFVTHKKALVPPFNYIRSLMLFETNETLIKALSIEDHAKMSAIETYLLINTNLEKLADHESTALLALIEFERTHRKTNPAHYPIIIKSIANMMSLQNRNDFSDSDRLLFTALYFNKSLNSVVRDMIKQLSK